MELSNVTLSLNTWCFAQVCLTFSHFREFGQQLKRESKTFGITMKNLDLLLYRPTLVKIGIMTENMGEHALQVSLRGQYPKCLLPFMHNLCLNTYIQWIKLLNMDLECNTIFYDCSMKFRFRTLRYHGIDLEH